MNIRRALKDLGFDTVDNKFYSLIDLWAAWYKGNVEDFHSYTVWNGIEELECHRYSVGMGKKVCEDWANLLMNERVNITLEANRNRNLSILFLPITTGRSRLTNRRSAKRQ